MRQLVGDDVESMNLRLAGEKLRRLGHQLFGDLALEMGVATALIGESVENPEASRAHLDGEPGRRSRFFIDHRPGAGQEGRDLLLHAGLGFELDIKRMLSHFALLSFAPRRRIDKMELGRSYGPDGARSTP